MAVAVFRVTMGPRISGGKITNRPSLLQRAGNLTPCHARSNHRCPGRRLYGAQDVALFNEVSSKAGEALTTVKYTQLPRQEPRYKKYPKPQSNRGVIMCFDLTSGPWGLELKIDHGTGLIDQMGPDDQLSF